MDAADATIVIPARNSAATIERAICSAATQNPSSIILIDHACTDDTTAIARRIYGGRLRVLIADRSATLGQVRRIGLEAVQTTFGMWLDADDELLDGRLTRLIGSLESEAADIAFDEVDLHDGPTGAFLRRLPIPGFLSNRVLAYTFARNYLPGLGVFAFRAETARRISFDPALHGAEDFDFLLRLIVAAVPVSLVRECGYRQFTYPTTLSRDLDNQRRMCQIALRKHDPSLVRKLLAGAGSNAKQIAWALVSFHVFRGDFEDALSWLEEADRLIDDRTEILEPDGPEPFAEGWRHDFYRGTVLAAVGRSTDAAILLERAVAAMPAPEALNNLGVALCAVGRTEESRALLARAVRGFPSYSDALANLRSLSPSRLTLHPLRQPAARTDYV